MRDILIIGIACAAAILLGAWLYFSGTEQTTPAPEGAVSYSVLDQGQFSGNLTERKNYRLKNAEELNALWTLVHGTGAPTSVDFEKNEVIGVFDGTHATGGYSVAITSVVDEPGVPRAVAITHTTPGESCRTTHAITSPFIIIVLPKSTAPLAHTDTEVVSECH